ncbi:hypothetical protein L3Y25_gp102 [Gordonia phage Syleon]|uniref:Uncharacterized protein n=1 Tax=Gordonia phage Syleon TaxID=2653718 RepID=A0A5Q2WDM2_9CAUD|nr:hypothetical protein L3Y25_gp102 [Gordonia phage Syleon]QGH75862.1 hypothetical protein SEA_SYLEON_139 [Gordonia phage Syleon]
MWPTEVGEFMGCELGSREIVALTT